MATGAGAPPPAFSPEGVDVVLRDGATVHVRAVTPRDATSLAALLTALGTESRRLRFFTAAVDVERMARSEADVADRDGVGLVAEREGRVLGHAEIVRIEPEIAEVAFETTPSAQGLGLATVLLALLAELARRWSIKRLTASVLPENRQMLEVFRASDLAVTERMLPGEIRITCRLDACDPGAERPSGDGADRASGGGNERPPTA